MDNMRRYAREQQFAGGVSDSCAGKCAQGGVLSTRYPPLERRAAFKATLLVGRALWYIGPREAHISTQEAGPEEGAWISRPHADTRRSAGPEAAPGEGEASADRFRVGPDEPPIFAGETRTRRRLSSRLPRGCSPRYHPPCHLRPTQYVEYGATGSGCGQTVWARHGAQPVAAASTRGHAFPGGTDPGGC